MQEADGQQCLLLAREEHLGAPSSHVCSTAGTAQDQGSLGCPCYTLEQPLSQHSQMPLWPWSEVHLLLL